LLRLNAGVVPIYEPGLKDIVQRNVREGGCHLTTSLSEAVSEAAAVFIAVGTPSRRGDGHADLSQFTPRAARSPPALTISPWLSPSRRSRLAPAMRSSASFRELRPDLDVAVVSNPEFLREVPRSTISSILDRIVIGTDDERAKKSWTKSTARSISTRPRSLYRAPDAELIKYAANAFLATKITFINEVADLCEKVWRRCARGRARHRARHRIGSKFLHAGARFGGSWLPQGRPRADQTAHDHDVPMRHSGGGGKRNDKRKRAMARKVSSVLLESCGVKTIAVLGLTFKPNTDDMRESPAIPIIVALQDMGAKVRVYDPIGMEQAKQVLTNVTYCDGAYECVDNADAGRHRHGMEQFRALDIERIKSLMACPVIVDLRISIAQRT